MLKLLPPFVRGFLQSGAGYPAGVLRRLAPRDVMDACSCPTSPRRAVVESIRKNTNCSWTPPDVEKPAG
jgi:hypothetical protein